MTIQIVTPQRVEAQIRAIDGWWRENRPSAPALFTEELAAGLELLRAAPSIGRRYPHTGVRDLRRLLLRATRHHVYYTQRGDTVFLLAVWSAVRGSGPDLAGLP